MVPRRPHGRSSPQAHPSKAHGLAKGWSMGPGLNGLNTALVVITPPDPPPTGGVTNIGFDWSDPDQSISLGL